MCTYCAWLLHKAETYSIHLDKIASNKHDLGVHFWSRLNQTMWKCRGLNSGLFMCKANTLPLSHIPTWIYETALISLVIWLKLNDKFPVCDYQRAIVKAEDTVWRHSNKAETWTGLRSNLNVNDFRGTTYDKKNNLRTPDGDFIHVEDTMFLFRWIKFCFIERNTFFGLMNIRLH